MNIHSWVYLAQFGTDGVWQGEFQNKVPHDKKHFAKLSPKEQTAIFHARNHFPELSLVSYSSQYAVSAFEGLKAFPQVDGSWAMFRPLDNCQRMQRSMAGILQPTMEPNQLLAILQELMRRTIEQDVTMQYQKAWEHNDFNDASSIYIRPFSYSEAGLGVNPSRNPWLVIISTPVSNYLDGQNPSAVISHRVRAMPNGTGSLKCASNYVISMLARHEAPRTRFYGSVIFRWQRTALSRRGFWL